MLLAFRPLPVEYKQSTPKPASVPLWRHQGVSREAAGKDLQDHIPNHHSNAVPPGKSLHSRGFMIPDLNSSAERGMLFHTAMQFFK